MERIEWREKREERGRMSLQFGVRLPSLRAPVPRNVQSRPAAFFLGILGMQPPRKLEHLWFCHTLYKYKTPYKTHFSSRALLKHAWICRNKSKNIINQFWKYPKYSINLFHSDPKDIKITSQLRHKASSSKVTKSSNEKKRKERERKTKQMDRKRERENGGRRKVWRGTYRSRVVHQSRRVPGDRWTPGSMERPHNWENSAGLLVGRTHSHLSCRDRPGIDGSPRFELTPVKSCVARCHGKSDPSHRPIDTGYYFPLVTRTFYQLAGWKLESMWSWLVI